ncbi:hypothetical protein BCR35DRAFT_302650 [Leucosporidium creatinivorum]|uniref:Uncharacterized protein n=1 Tax=Leucosporidium creatinivorum TaxID=106004 RepID=A0A1Y2FPT9_9BASI|nr:hypothetical protein BCR35DRAFT_302650 [Leucosporidium creatinivorum]
MSPTWGSAGVFYGVWARTASLNFCAEATLLLRGSLKAIDHIILRRRLNTLRIEHAEGGAESGLLKMPEEVWRLVRRCLIEEVYEMEQRVMNKLRCTSCEKEGWEEARKEGDQKGQPLKGAGEDTIEPPVKPKYRWASWSEPDCRRCASNGESFLRSQGNIARIRDILKHCGLDLVTPAESLFDTEQEWETFLPIGVSNRKEGDRCSSYPNIDTYGGSHDDIGPTTVVPFAADLLQLPADADDRFARLVAETRIPQGSDANIPEELELFNFGSYLPSLASSSGTEKPSGSASVKPCWMLYAACGQD